MSRITLTLASFAAATIFAASPSVASVGHADTSAAVDWSSRTTHAAGSTGPYLPKIAVKSAL